MAATFTRHVYVLNADGDVVWFTPGDDCPDWARRRIENAAVLDVAEEEDARVPEGEPDSTWRLAQLRDYAEERSIDLGEATKKADILTAIEAHAGGGSASGDGD